MRQRAEVELEALYRRYRGDVYRYALSASRDENEADDVTQAAFLSAYRALARGGSPRSPRAWLIAIAENVRRRRLRRPREAALPESYEAPAPEPDVSAGELVDAIGSLPEAQRRVLLLRELGGRSYGEIATELETTVGSVQMLLFRARRELRERLKRVAGVPAPLWPQGWNGAAAPALRAGAAVAGAVALALGAGGAAPPDRPLADGAERGLVTPTIPVAKSAATSARPATPRLRARPAAGERPRGAASPASPAAAVPSALPPVASAIPSPGPGSAPLPIAPPVHEAPSIVPALPQPTIAIPPPTVAIPPPTVAIPAVPSLPTIQPPPLPTVEPPPLPLPTVEPPSLPTAEPPALPALPLVPEAPALP